MELLDDAAAVLDGNWLGRSTKPAPHLYPHQWSWDSAFIAIGNAARRWERSAAELRSLFAAQWSNGMIPHIVFDADATGYTPSPSEWGCRVVPAAPDHLDTSGICQPAVHATAVRLVAEQAPDDTARSAFLLDLYEPLVAWHGYLHEVRRVDGGLIEIWHPWESGMDNSPAWDAPMARLAPDPSDIPPYLRADTDHAPAEDRPTDLDYDRYMYLVEQLRRSQYAPTDPKTLEFRVHDVLFNAVAVASDRDLGWIADQLGLSADAALWRERSLRLADQMHTELWHDHTGVYLSKDVTTGDHIPVVIAGGLVALLCDPPPDRCASLARLITDRFGVPAGSGLLVPTVPTDDTAFDARRYWRGPVWINIMWLIAGGLDRNGEQELAQRLRIGIIDLVTEGGFAEYFSPIDGTGHGSFRFSWTAALTTEILLSGVLDRDR